MKSLTFGIFGYGKMGRIRYATLQKMPGCTVKWICDVGQPADFPQGVRYTHLAQDILSDPAVDVLVVCAPNDLIKDTVVQGLMNGKHVFAEKPPGRTLAELEEMIAAENLSQSLKLMFGFNHRHHESMLQTKKLIDSGEYGKILWIRGRYGKDVDKNFFSSWRASKDIAGGGIFLDQGIHMLDLFLMFCDDFEEVKSFVSNLYWKLDVEDNVFAIFRNNRGQVASLHSTMTQWRHLFSLEIFLERGYMVINGLKTPSNAYGDEVLTIAKNRTPPPEASWSDEDKYVFPVDVSWRRELDIFVDAIRDGKEIPVGNSRDARKLMRLVEKVYAQQ